LSISSNLWYNVDEFGFGSGILMTDDTSDIAIADARLACRRVVRALIQKYDWALLEEDELVGLVLGSTQPEAPPAELKRLTRHHYTIALYEACRQTQDAKRRERGYHELHCFLYNRRPELAEDAAQRALELVHEQIERCRNPAAFLTFAFYKMRDALKREARLVGKELPLVEMEESLSDRTASPAQSPLEQGERIRALVEAVRRLSDRRQQKVIILKYLGGLSDEEIGERLGLTVSNVRVLRHRGITRLRMDEDLKDYFRESKPGKLGEE
jgi:RNA polymerase sigma factor (sigma-70 family)